MRRWAWLGRGLNSGAPAGVAILPALHIQEFPELVCMHLWHDHTSQSPPRLRSRPEQIASSPPATRSVCHGGRGGRRSWGSCVTSSWAGSFRLACVANPSAARWRPPVLLVERSHFPQIEISKSLVEWPEAHRRGGGFSPGPPIIGDFLAVWPRTPESANACIRIQPGCCRARVQGR